MNAYVMTDRNKWNWQLQPGRSLVSNGQWKKIIDLLDLTDRELIVCQLLFLGLTRNDIAERMDVSLRTIRQFMERIHKKLRVKNRVELVLRIIEVRDSL